jgi:hypothetical protein
MPIHDWTRVPAEIFHDFRATWFAELKRALNSGVLPANHYALIEQIAGGAGPPDFALDRPVISSHINRDGYPRKALVVRQVEGDRVVAVLEIVLPGNKIGHHAVRTFTANTVALLRAGINVVVVDLFPPGPADPKGIHDAIWSILSDQEFVAPDGWPLTVASYTAGEHMSAYVMPTRVGEKLPDAPLFLVREEYVTISPEASYLAGFSNFPNRWREVVELSSGN